MADVLIDFNEGRKLHRVQQARLGELATDDLGNTWSYVQFREAVNIGEVVRDAKHADLVNGGGAITPVTAASNTDSDRLTASGIFNNQDVRGAIGAIVSGNGYGQNFIVIDRIQEDAARSNNTIQVHVLTSRTTAAPLIPKFVTDGTWDIALATGATVSNFRLAFPGAVFQGEGLADNVRGFSQVNVTANELNQYGWVQQTGLGFVKLDASDADVPVIGEGLVQAGNGLVKGFTHAGTTADDAANIIAKCLIGDYTGANDTLMWAELCVVNRAQSYRLPHERHPFAQPGQRI